MFKKLAEKLDNFLFFIVDRVLIFFKKKPKPPCCFIGERVGAYEEALFKIANLTHKLPKSSKNEIASICREALFKEYHDESYDV